MVVAIPGLIADFDDRPEAVDLVTGVLGRPEGDEVADVELAAIDKVLAVIGIGDAANGDIFDAVSAVDGRGVFEVTLLTRSCNMMTSFCSTASCQVSLQMPIAPNLPVRLGNSASIFD